MEKERNELLIPFVKPARVGNYKVWRSKISVSYDPTDEQREKVRMESGGRERAVRKTVTIEAVNVSNLDGSWRVQIPSTCGMFGFICSQYATIDEEKRDNFLGMVFTNMLNINLTPSPALHDALFFLTEMMSYPYMLLSEKEMVKRMRDGLKKDGMDKKKADEHIKQMVEYRTKLYSLIDDKKARFLEDYERQQEERRAKEPEENKHLEQDEIAEQAMELLKNDDAAN